jgi:hypothetical protein
MIIGFVGLIGSGKDTAADYLVNNRGFKRDSFAAPLKDAVANVFGWDRNLLEGATAESRHWREQTDLWWAKRLGILELTPRWILQQWGTEVGRQGFHTDIWVASLENRLRTATSNIVITDCRFPNEIKAIQEAGGKVFKIQRGADPDWVHDAMWYLEFPAGKPPSDIPHQSEWAWMGLDLDGFILNHGTIDELNQSIDNALNIHYNDPY